MIQIVDGPSSEIASNRADPGCVEEIKTIKRIVGFTFNVCSLWVQVPLVAGIPLSDWLHFESEKSIVLILVQIPTSVCFKTACQRQSSPACASVMRYNVQGSESWNRKCELSRTYL